MYCTSTAPSMAGWLAVATNTFAFQIHPNGRSNSPCSDWRPLVPFFQLIRGEGTRMGSIATILTLHAQANIYEERALPLFQLVCVVSCRGLDCRSSILLWLGSGAIGTPPLGTVARQKISSLSVLYFLFGGLERAEDTVAHLAHLFSSAS